MESDNMDKEVGKNKEKQTLPDPKGTSSSGSMVKIIGTLKDATSTFKANTNNTVDQTTKVSTLTKIAPKPTTLNKTISPGGQIVYIQSLGGTPQPIRIANTATATPVVANSSGAIQFYKTSDGSYLQLKNKTTSQSSTKTSPITAAVLKKSEPQSNTHIGKFIVKGGTGQRIVLSTPATTTKINSAVTTKSNSTPTNVPRTYTVAQAQQMGLLSSSKIKELVSAATAQKKTQPTSILPGPIVTVIKPKQIPTQTQKIIVQTSTGVHKQVAIPQHLVKLAQSGQIKAVNVAGKGIQYVRVVNATSASTTSPNSAITTTTTTQQPTTTTTNASTITTAQPAQSKLLVQSKGGQQTYTLLSSNSMKKHITTISGTTIKQNVKPHAIQTVAPVKKLVSSNEHISSIPIITPKIEKFDSPSTTSIQQVQSSQQHLLLTDSKPISSGIKPLLGDVKSLNDIKSIKFVSAAEQHLKLLPKMENVDYSLSRKSYPNKIDQEASSDESASIYNVVTHPSSPDGIRRKHCNCTKSQCLKLYCDCFANGEFCFNCNCKECFNNLENEEERLKAIKMCLERNPHAFKPKIGKAKEHNETLRRHTKGCNCKRSGCLKNYCECYEAKIACSGNCKCIGCRNIEDTIDVRGSNNFGDMVLKMSERPEKRPYERDSSPVNLKKPCNFMTPDVIEATIQCIIAQADECQQNNYSKSTSEKLLLEEFGRCLVEIIDFSKKNNDN